MQIVTASPGGQPLIGYLHSESPEMSNRAPRPSVLVVPGGGYNFCSDREKEPPALALLAAGFNVFVQSAYSTEENARNLRPLTELSASVVCLRENAAEWNLDPKRIAVMGFSSGGHLAASLGCLWDSPELQAIAPTKAGQNRPDAMILCYPVISSGEHAHASSFVQLAGDDAKLKERLSLEKRVTAQTPPTFLWHTATDICVPVENTLLMAAALQREQVPFECHVFTSGTHGLAMCNGETGGVNEVCAPWFPLAVRWLSNLFNFQL